MNLEKIVDRPPSAKGRARLLEIYQTQYRELMYPPHAISLFRRKLIEQVKGHDGFYCTKLTEKGIEYLKKEGLI